MSDEIRLPPPDPPPDHGRWPSPPHGSRPQPEPSTFEGCLVIFGKVVLVLVVGVFVLAGLVFATCFLSMR